ncbi:MAG TPA: hypothetical protein PLN38_17470 [Chitinophagales bacterium]|nr:hypothetical protein [Chitinophagales bacterium]
MLGAVISCKIKLAMGQNAHRKFKEYEKAKQENKRFPAWCSNEKVKQLEMEWRLQEIKDKADELSEIEYYNRTYGKG